VPGDLQKSQYTSSTPRLLQGGSTGCLYAVFKQTIAQGQRLFPIVEILRKITFLGPREPHKLQISMVCTPPDAGTLERSQLSSVSSDDWIGPAVVP
jgi:hypothetical protein